MVVPVVVLEVPVMALEGSQSLVLGLQMLPLEGIVHRHPRRLEHQRHQIHCHHYRSLVLALVVEAELAELL